MREDRTPRRTHHWYEPAGTPFWENLLGLKGEYDFKDWRPAVIVAAVVLLGIVLAAWLAHLPPVAIFFLLLADLALAGIIWNNSARS